MLTKLTKSPALKALRKKQKANRLSPIRPSSNNRKTITWQLVLEQQQEQRRQQEQRQEQRRQLEQQELQQQEQQELRQQEQEQLQQELLPS
jgi:hypothetical protein